MNRKSSLILRRFSILGVGFLYVCIAKPNVFNKVMVCESLLGFTGIMVVLRFYRECAGLMLREFFVIFRSTQPTCDEVFLLFFAPYSSLEVCFCEHNLLVNMMLYSVSHSTQPTI